jgi:DNA polymerase-1
MYKYAVIDIETTGLDRFKNTITYVGIGLANDTLKKIIVIDMSKANSMEKLNRVFNKISNQKLQTVFQNGKFDTLFLETYNMLIPIHHDVMLMGTAYDLTAKHSLKDMAKNYLQVENWDVTKKVKTGYSKETEQYLKKDIQYTWELFKYFSNIMTEGQLFVYKNLLRPAYLLYKRVERTGIYLDVPALEKVKKDYKAKQEQAHKVLINQYDINWNSPAQVSEVLFNREKLPTLKLSQKTGKPSADAKILKRLSAQGYEITKQLLEYKFYYGANTKFLNNWGEYAKYDGRIHPSFHITNVITGRTSCSDPNLQQVPRNPELRSLFTAPKDRLLIEADYSQIELRIAADYADEPTMIQIYKTGGDIHTETAASVMGKSVDQVKKDDRSKAKAVNFGFLYGMMAKKFAEYAYDNYGVQITRNEAERYRELFFNKYSRLLAWHEETAQLCEMLGGVENKFGRFISLPNIYSDDFWEKQAAIRKAINAPVQGTASDLLLLSAVEIDKKLRPEFDLKIVGTVHDSILMDCPEKYVEEVVALIKKIMSNPEALKKFGVKFKIPIEADVGIGAWGSK